MITQISTALTALVTMLGNVVTAVVDTTDGALNGLLPLIAISCAGSIIMFGFKLVRSSTYGW